MIINFEQARRQRDHSVQTIDQMRLWSKNTLSIGLEDAFNLNPIYKVRPHPAYKGAFLPNNEEINLKENGPILGIFEESHKAGAFRPAALVAMAYFQAEHGFNMDPYGLLRITRHLLYDGEFLTNSHLMQDQKRQLQQRIWQTVKSLSDQKGLFGHIFIQS